MDKISFIPKKEGAEFKFCFGKFRKKKNNNIIEITFHAVDSESAKILEYS